MGTWLRDWITPPWGFLALLLSGVGFGVVWITFQLSGVVAAQKTEHEALGSGRDFTSVEADWFGSLYFLSFLPLLILGFVAMGLAIAALVERGPWGPRALALVALLLVIAYLPLGFVSFGVWVSRSS